MCSDGIRRGIGIAGEVQQGNTEVVVQTMRTYDVTDEQTDSDAEEDRRVGRQVEKSGEQGEVKSMADINSIDAYTELLNTDYLGEKQREVFHYIQKHPNCTYNQISRDLKLHHNTCTARIKELRMYGLIIKSEDVIDPFTNKRNNAYRVRRPNEPADPIKRQFLAIPKAVKDVIIDMVNEVSKLTEYEYSDSNGDYRVTQKNGMATLELNDMYYFDEIGMYSELNAQGLFVIYGMDFHFVFKVK